MLNMEIGQFDNIWSQNIPHGFDKSKMGNLLFGGNFVPLF